MKTFATKIVVGLAALLGSVTLQAADEAKPASACSTCPSANPSAQATNQQSDKGTLFIAKLSDTNKKIYEKLTAEQKLTAMNLAGFSGTNPQAKLVSPDEAVQKVSKEVTSTK